MLPHKTDLTNSTLPYNRFQNPDTGLTSSTQRSTDASSTEASKTAASAEAKPASRADLFDVNALVKQIWGFASQRIAQAEAEGASASELDAMWEAAAKGVEQGFGQARDVLDGMGELDEPLSMKINSAYGQIMDLLAERDSSARLPGAEITENVPAEASAVSSAALEGRRISLYQYQRQTFSLDLTTLQGDKIQIRSVYQQAANAEDFNFGERSATLWGSQQESGFSLYIKGNLSDQERADLDALLAQVNELANEFYQGDYERAFDMAQKLNIDGTSLRSMDLNLRETEQKGAAVYAGVADQPARLPKGLAPLQAYANRLLEAQAQWQQAFNAPEGLLKAMENHPLNRGDLQHLARMMIV